MRTSVCAAGEQPAAAASVGVLQHLLPAAKSCIAPEQTLSQNLEPRQELEAGQDALCVADHLNAVFLVLLEHAPFAIASWSDWHAAFQALPARHRAAAERLGVTQRRAHPALFVA